MKYSPALDSLRCFAVLAVLGFHAKMPVLKGGFLGVDIFFVLSGFLITFILFSEIQKTGGVNLKQFYRKRLVRLYPPLVLCILLYLFLAPFLWPKYSGHTRDAVISMFYLADYAKAFYKIPVYLSHIWSLSVEVHFYIIWPFVLLVLTKLKLNYAVFILAVFYLLATAWRLFVFSDSFWHMAYFRFDTRLSGLIAGSWLAFMVIKYEQHRNSGIAGAIGIALIIFAVSISSWAETNGMAAGVLLAEIGAVLLVYYLFCANNSFIFQWRPIVYLGQLSYGIYLFHYPIFVYLRKIYDWPVTLIIGSPIAILLAAISYHTIESVFRNKRKVMPNPASEK